MGSCYGGGSKGKGRAGVERERANPQLLTSLRVMGLCGKHHRKGSGYQWGYGGGGDGGSNIH